MAAASDRASLGVQGCPTGYGIFSRLHFRHHHAAESSRNTTWALRSDCIACYTVWSARRVSVSPSRPWSGKMLTRQQLGTPYGGWVAFQPLYQLIVKEQPDLLD